jgi:DNA helicase HerA-like ATPase
VPVFVLIDEAHNLVPEETGDAAMERVASQVMRIASEGRKFGLFLILATQRPAKLRRGLLAECENVCVMHLQSPVDHEAAAATWGGPSPEIARARHFGRGDGLLMGRWVPAATAIHAAWRRTEECGGRLDPDYWAKPWPPTDPPGDPP